MSTLQFIHWKPAEAEPVKAEFEAQGYRVILEPFSGPASFRQIRQDMPDAILIDLSRAPSQGRDVGVSLRCTKATRHIPIVFLGGDPEKVNQIRDLLPDAFYTNWNELSKRLPVILSTPVSNLVVPGSVFAGYSGTPLVKKLGIHKNSVLLLLNAPRTFETMLDTLPGNVEILRDISAKADTIIWFNTRRTMLEEQIVEVAALLSDRGNLWIAWPKKKSGIESDLTQAEVRRIGLANGLVDYKICAIDTVWSGLNFARRRNTSSGNSTSAGGV